MQLASCMQHAQLRWRSRSDALVSQILSLLDRHRFLMAVNEGGRSRGAAVLTRDRMRAASRRRKRCWVRALRDISRMLCTLHLERRKISRRAKNLESSSSIMTIGSSSGRCCKTPASILRRRPVRWSRVSTREASRLAHATARSSTACFSSASYGSAGAASAERMGKVVCRAHFLEARAEHPPGLIGIHLHRYEPTVPAHRSRGPACGFE